MIRAPIATSLSVKYIRDSNIFRGPGPCLCTAWRSPPQSTSNPQERGPGSVIDLGHGTEGVTPHLAGAIPVTVRVSPSTLTSTPSLLKPKRVESRVLDGSTLPPRSAPRYHGEAHEGPGFDVVRAHRKRGASQLGHAGDMKLVGTNSFDSGTHRIEETAKILDVRLRSGVSDQGFSLGEDSGHDGILGGRDRGLIQEEVRSSEIPPLDLEPAGTERLLRAPRTPGMSIQSATPDDVAPGGWKVDLSKTSQEWTSQED